MTPLNEWDKLSEIDSEVLGQVDYDSNLNTIGGLSSAIAGQDGSANILDGERKGEIDSFPLHCTDFGETTIANIESNDIDDQALKLLDSVSRFKKSKRPRRRLKSAVKYYDAAADFRMAATGFIDTGAFQEWRAHQRNAMEIHDRGDPVAAPPAGRLARLLTKASGILAQAATHCKARLCSAASLFGYPPLDLVGNFLSPSEVWSAIWQLSSDDDEECDLAKILLHCAFSFMMLLVLSCASIALVVSAFLVNSEDHASGQKPTETGMFDAQGSPKSMTRVVAVVLISLLSGNGLALNHPIRNALFCGL
jgi:preprotein translocase subunit SecG